ncbi:MAG: OB-fold putative lipoprotein [Bacteroidota bacterium]|nr:OB-fold putative lipoprotein [Bacteroidota bacterium]
MSKRLLKNIIFILVLLFVIAAAAGYFSWNKPHINIVKAPAIEISAVTLYKLFITDSIQAKSLYVNKVLNVPGTVKTIAVNQEHQQIILLKTSEADASVNCTMEKNTAEIKVGDQVSIKGFCVGYIGGEAAMGLRGDVFLTRCYRSA